MIIFKIENKLVKMEFIIDEKAFDSFAKMAGKAVFEWHS